MTLATQTPPTVEQAAIVRAVTVIMGTAVELTFLFGVGNFLNIALRLGLPVWSAPLVAPAVDLSVLGPARHPVLHSQILVTKIVFSR